MKNLLIIPFILVCSLSFAQSLPGSQTVSKQKSTYIKPSTKILKYEILVKEANKDIFKSSFKIKNGNEFIILNKEMGIQHKDMTQKSGISNKEEIISMIKSTEKESGDIEQLRLIANIGKDNNIISEFSWKTINVTNTKSMDLLSQESQVAVTEDSPIVHNNDIKILVTHSKNNETFFILDKKEFTIKAVY